MRFTISEEKTLIKRLMDQEEYNIQKQKFIDAIEEALAE